MIIGWAFPFLVSEQTGTEEEKASTACDKVMRENGTSIYATHLVYSLIMFMVQTD